jgi:hypothetical protein
MIITINGRSIDPSEVNGQNLEEILVDIQERHMPPDHVVSEVKINGQAYSEDVPHAAVEVSRSDITALDLSTVSSEEIARHFIENGSELFDSMIASLPRITEMFRLGDEAEANEHYLRFLESLHLLVSMLEKVCQVMGIEYQKKRPEEESLTARVNTLAEILSNLLSIQEQSDWIYLADVLEYELTPLLEAVSQLLPTLKASTH